MLMEFVTLAKLTKWLEIMLVLVPQVSKEMPVQEYAEPYVNKVNILLMEYVVFVF